MLSGSVAGCIAACAAMLCAGIQKKNITLRINAICLAAFAVVCAAALSIAHTAFPPIVWRSVFLLITFAATSYAFFIFISESGEPGAPLWVVPLFSLAFILLAALQYFDHDPLAVKSRYAYDLWRGYRAYAVFGNPNLMADFLAIAAPVCVGVGAFHKDKRQRILGWAAAVGIIPCLIAAGSRGALLGAAAGTGVMVICLSATGARRSALPYVALAPLLIAAISVFVVFQGKTIKRESMRQRLMTWNISISMIRKNPATGVGFDRFGREFLSYQAEYLKKPASFGDVALANIEKQRHAHNEYLQTAAETGIPGLVAFLALIAALALRLTRCAFARGPSGPVASALLGSLFSFCAVAFFSFPLRIPITASMLALLAACAAACPTSARPASRGVKFPSAAFLSEPRVRAEAWALIILIAFLALIDLSAEPLLSSVLTKAGQRSYSGGQSAEAQSYCGKALTADWLNGDAAYCLGLAYLAAGHYDESEYFLRMSLKAIDDPFIHYNMGVANVKMKNYAAAENEFKTMRAMAPTYTGRILEIARLYKSAQLYAIAVEYYSEAVPLLEAEARKSPDDPVPHLMLADCAYELGDMEGYKLHLEDALKRSPADPRIIKALEALRNEGLEKKP